MQFAAILLLLVCYGLAAYLAWLQRTPLYLFALLAGHLAALASPLWQLLYELSFDRGLDNAATLLGQPIPLAVILGSGWHYTLPALVVYFLFTVRWWFPGVLTGLLTFVIFLLYHLLIESVGLNSRLWAYSGQPLPLSFSRPLLSALMGAVVSYGLLYAVISLHRASWQSLIVALLPAPLLLSLLVNGLLGAPLWGAILLDGASWVLLIGLLSTLILLAWAVQIITGGLRRLAS